MLDTSPCPNFPGKSTHAGEIHEDVCSLGQTRAVFVFCRRDLFFYRGGGDTEGPKEVTQLGPCSSARSVSHAPGVLLGGRGVFAWSLERCNPAFIIAAAGGEMGRPGWRRSERARVVGNSVACAALAADSETAPSRRGPSARPLPQAGWQLVFSDAAVELHLGLSDSKIRWLGSAEPNQDFGSC